MRFPVANQEMSRLELEIHDKGWGGRGEVFGGEFSGGRWQFSVFSFQWGAGGLRTSGLGLGTWVGDWMGSSATITGQLNQDGDVAFVSVCFARNVISPKPEARSPKTKDPSPNP